MDSDHTAKAKKIVYATLHAATSCVDDPRDVRQFSEIGDDGLPSGRQYYVQAYDETAADVITWVWCVEAQRQN